MYGPVCNVNYLKHSKLLSALKITRIIFLIFCEVVSLAILGASINHVDGFWDIFYPSFPLWADMVFWTTP